MPEAAKAVGVSETTLWRWLQRDDFQKYYRDARDKVFDGALGALQRAAKEAVNCLRRNLECSRPGVQVQAARTIIDFTLKARELFDLEIRLAQLEAARMAVSGTRSDASRGNGLQAKGFCYAFTRSRLWLKVKTSSGRAEITKTNRELEVMNENDKILLPTSFIQLTR